MEGKAQTRDPRWGQEEKGAQIMKRFVGFHREVGFTLKRMDIHGLGRHDGVYTCTDGPDLCAGRQR